MTNHSYPPGDWSVEELVTALAATEETFPLPTFEDADTWNQLRRGSLTGSVVESILAAADHALERPLPSLPASGYLNYTRATEHGTYLNKDDDMRRRKRLSLFVLAECFEREGRYLDAILDYAWALCEQTTWLLPAHLSDAQDHDGLPRPVQPEARGLALFSARAAQLLAEVDYVMGDRLHPALRDRIRQEVERRVLEPYEARDDLHWEGAARKQLERRLHGEHGDCCHARGVERQSTRAVSLARGRQRGRVSRRVRYGRLHRRGHQLLELRD